jgi:flavin-dependent dehydrogenase
VGTQAIEDVDLFIAGGGIGGSVAAKFAAMGGLEVVFIERYKTPRHKPCSGIQFPYFERILGEKIPADRLCKVQIQRTEMHFPDGSSMAAPFRAFNYMRNVFDDWLNQRAQEEGARFMDECELIDCEEADDRVIVTFTTPDGAEQKVKARYVIDATGLSSLPIRRKLRPQDFGTAEYGGGINYYIDGEADLDPGTMYQFWNLDFSDAMFAWIYTKTFDDGQDYWVVGTGSVDDTIHERQKRFYDFVREKYDMRGEIVHTEEYKTAMDTKSEDRVWLGQGRMLMVGDAAGLLDGVRGVGQDAAALSGRLAAKAILRADERGTRALDEYEVLTRRITRQTRKNQSRAIEQFTTNEELQRHLRRGMLRTGILMTVHAFLNRFRSPERLKLLPP